MSSAINWNDCIKQSNNKPDLAQDLLNMLALELPKFQQDISDALNEKNRKQLKFHTHKLHGACCYCGANDLKKTLYQFENEIDHMNTAELVQATQNIQHEIQRLQHSLHCKDYL
jgi:two-component system, NarL family, sensor histidine kinase BarA